MWPKVKDSLYPDYHVLIVHFHIFTELLYIITQVGSNVSGKWLMKGHILPAVKIGHPMILRDLKGDWKADEPRKATVSWFIEKETRARISKQR